jgi:hypothetical protein
MEKLPYIKERNWFRISKEHKRNTRKKRRIFVGAVCISVESGSKRI